MLTSFVKGLAKRCGLYVGRLSVKYPERSLEGLLRKQGINLVLDVGANTGQFASELRGLGYRGRIISFEPLGSAYSVLSAKAASDPLWTIAERGAVGAENSSIEIHESGNSYSSSVLPILSSHVEAAPDSAYVSTEMVPVRRLDDLWTPAADDRVLLKIDVQGYEAYVLSGAPRTLANCSALITEMSVVPLYEGQTLAKELWDRLVEEGFEVWSLEPMFREPGSGKMLQMDGFFYRMNKA